MAFTPAEKASIRVYLGRPKLFQNSNSQLELSIAAVEALSDSGATEALMRAALVNLASIEAQITALYPTLIASSIVGEMKVLPGFAISFLKAEGTRTINQLCIPLGLDGPYASYFYPMATDDSGWH
jgi:hypothetical protein